MDEENEVLDWGNEDDEQNQDPHRSQTVDLDADDAVSLGDESERESPTQERRSDEKASRDQISPPLDPLTTPETASSSRFQAREDNEKPKNNSPSRVQPALTTSGRLTHALPPKPTVVDVPIVPPSSKATSMKALTRGTSKRANGTPPATGKNPSSTDDLPSDWETRHSRKGEPYYYNTKTHNCTWTRPSCSGADKAHPPDDSVSSGADKAGPSSSPALSKRTLRSSLSPRRPSSRLEEPNHRPVDQFSNDDRYYRSRESERPSRNQEPRTHERDDIRLAGSADSTVDRSTSLRGRHLSSVPESELPAQRGPRESETPASRLPPPRPSKQREEFVGAGSESRHHPQSQRELIQQSRKEPHEHFEKERRMQTGFGMLRPSDDPGYPTANIEREERAAMSRRSDEQLYESRRHAEPPLQQSDIEQPYLAQNGSYTAPRHRSTHPPAPEYRHEQPTVDRYEMTSQPPVPSKRKEKVSRFGPSLPTPRPENKLPSSQSNRRDPPGTEDSSRPLRPADPQPRSPPTREPPRREYGADSSSYSVEDRHRRREPDAVHIFDLHRSTSGSNITSPTYAANQSRSEGRNRYSDHGVSNSLLPEESKRGYSIDTTQNIPVMERDRVQVWHREKQWEEEQTEKIRALGKVHPSRLARLASATEGPTSAANPTSLSSRGSQGYSAKPSNVQTSDVLHGDLNPRQTPRGREPRGTESQSLPTPPNTRMDYLHEEPTPARYPATDSTRQRFDLEPEPAHSYKRGRSLSRYTESAPTSYGPARTSEDRGRALPPVARDSGRELYRNPPVESRDPQASRKPTNKREPPPLASGTNQIPLKGDRYANKDGGRRTASSERQPDEHHGLESSNGNRADRLRETLPPGKGVYERPSHAEPPARHWDGPPRREPERPGRRPPTPPAQEFSRRMDEVRSRPPHMMAPVNVGVGRMPTRYNEGPKPYGTRSTDAGSDGSIRREERDYRMTGSRDAPPSRPPRDEPEGPPSPQYGRRDAPPPHTGTPSSKPLNWDREPPYKAAPPPSAKIPDTPRISGSSLSPSSNRISAPAPMVHPLPPNPMLARKEPRPPVEATIVEPVAEERSEKEKRRSRWGSPVRSNPPPPTTNPVLQDVLRSRDQHREPEPPRRPEPEQVSQPRKPREGPADVEMVPPSLSNRMERAPPLARGNSLLERLTGPEPPSLRDRVSIPSKRDHTDLNGDGYDLADAETSQKRRRRGGTGKSRKGGGRR